MAQIYAKLKEILTSLINLEETMLNWDILKYTIYAFSRTLE